MKTENQQGTVTNIDDPAKAGRIKVALQSMDGQEYPEWVEPVWPGGWIAIPEVGDTVELTLPEGEDIVEFAEEVRYLGKVLTGAHPVPEDFKENYPKRRGFRSPAGHTIIFDDDDGIVLTTGVASGKNVGVSIDAKANAVQIFGSSSVQISSTAAITIMAPSITILGRPVLPGGGPI